MTKTESNQKTLDFLISYFNDSGWPYEIDLKKLRSKSSISSIDSDPNIKKLKIERHRAILGAQYRQGLPMDAYQTYWMVYLINLSTGKVEDLGEEEGGCNVDISGLIEKELDFEFFSLGIELMDNGEYRVSESVSGGKIDAVSIDHAYKLLSDITPNRINYFKEELDNQELISQIEKDNFLSEYKVELQRQIINKLNDLWESREIR